MTTEYVLDGSRITSLDEFYREADRALGLLPGSTRNLDSLDDTLSGGDQGIPDDGIVLRWKNSAVSRQHLSYSETVRQLETKLLRCHPDARAVVQAELDAALRGTGPTVFDWLQRLIQENRNVHTLLE